MTQLSAFEKALLNDYKAAYPNLMEELKDDIATARRLKEPLRSLYQKALGTSVTRTDHVNILLSLIDTVKKL